LVAQDRTRYEQIVLMVSSHSDFAELLSLASAFVIRGISITDRPTASTGGCRLWQCRRSYGRLFSCGSEANQGTSPAPATSNGCRSFLTLANFSMWWHCHVDAMPSASFSLPPWALSRRDGGVCSSFLCPHAIQCALVAPAPFAATPRKPGHVTHGANWSRPALCIGHVRLISRMCLKYSRTGSFLRSICKHTTGDK
jgi:hypothetical protein